MIGALLEALGEAREDPAIRVIVLEAAGRVFSAGHDLAELRADEDPARHLRLFHRCADLMLAIGDSPKPVIAKVTGAAVAAGCQLVASCDLAYADRGARFAVSGIDLGLFCSTPSVALSRKVGAAAAAEMLFTGRFIDAHEAAAIGLLNRVADGDRLEAVVGEVAGAIAEKPPQALALGKAFFRQQLEMPRTGAYELASRRMAENLAFPCAKAGIDAFLSRRAVRATTGN
jgi:enoyl-CoA hydratase/carnithine racemase